MLLILWLAAQWSYGQDSIFIRSEEFLHNYVSMGKVDYKRIQLDRAQFDSLIRMYQEYDLTGRSDDFRKAFYINAYNIMVIYGIEENYPVSSPMDIEGFFKEKKFRVAREDLTLDQIEFERLFAVYDDPRMHFALNCAAMSCPTLFNEAFVPEELDDQLDFCQLMVIDRADYVIVDDENKQILVSRVFDWYQDIFVKHAGSLRQYINQSRFVSLPKDYPIVFMDYDWSLNELLN